MIDSMFEGVTEGTIMIIITIIVTGIAGGLTSHFRKRADTIKELQRDLEQLGDHSDDKYDDLKKRLYRFEKAFIILVKLQQDVIEKTHPELRADWEDVVKELLNGGNR